MQLEAAAAESVSFANRYPTCFGTTFQINDVDQTDILMGYPIVYTDDLPHIMGEIVLMTLEDWLDGLRRQSAPTPQDNDEAERDDRP